MPSDNDLTTAIATLREYARSCHDEIGQAGARVCDAYAELLSLWTSQTVKRAQAERERDGLRIMMKSLIGAIEGGNAEVLAIAVATARAALRAREEG